jgi:glycosyltransferase involved in cell wall biosynthesis
MTYISYIGGEDIRMRIPILSLLKRRGFKVEAIGNNDSEAFSKTNINYRDYPLNRWLSPLADKESKLCLAELFANNKPDIIHLFDTKPGVLVPKVAKESGVKFVVRTVTGMGYIYSSNSLFSRLLRPFYRMAQKKAIAYTDMVIFQNTDDKKYFEKHNLVSADKSVLIRSSGLPVDEFVSKQANLETKKTMREKHNINKGDVVVTLIARLVKDKGITEFLESAKLLSTEKNIKFFLIGPLGSEGKQAISKEMIESYSEYINYIGSVNNVAEYLSISDVFVLPTYYREGLPRILLEAGSLGLPLITTDMPGCRDVVKDGWNGLLVPTRDSHALAKAIGSLANNQELRMEMGGKNPEYIKNNFDLSIVEKAYSDIYSKLLHPI